MTRIFYQLANPLTCAWFQAGIVLTLCFSFFTIHTACGDNVSQSIQLSSSPTPNYEKPVTAAPTPLQQQQMGQAMHYARQQIFGLFPTMSQMSFGLSDWFKDGKNLLSLVLGDSADDDTFLHPYSGLMQPAAANATQNLWLLPGYHYKGFFPTHDTLSMGVDYRHRLVDPSLQLDVHPFVGQNGFNSYAYWGNEVSLNFGALPHYSYLGAGKIVLRYDNGRSDLMEHGRGLDMHSELALDEHLSLHGGIRQDEDSQLGNYVLLRWTLVGGN